MGKLTKSFQAVKNYFNLGFKTPEIAEKKLRAYTPLGLVSQEGEADSILEVLKRGDDINEKDYDGNTALMLAVKHGKMDAVRTLIDNKADLNIKDKHGYTALRLATRYEQKEIAGLLIDKGASLDGVIEEQRIGQLEKTAREAQVQPK